MHEYYMKMAIDEAQKGMHNTFTNPLVGAVIVKNNQVLAKGAHLQYGHEHAERNAIAQCSSSEDLLNSTLYVTLEPCSHFGKQPPCSQLVVDSGIKTVVVGQLDPNPLVQGKGIAYLKDHGLEVIVGILEQEVQQLNPYYNFFHQNQRPYIVLKQAMTLDGKIAINQNTRTAITGEPVWHYVHAERTNYQGILVGSQTVLTDNPTLLSSGDLKYSPIRMILDRRGRTLNPSLNIYQDSSSPVWVFTEFTSPFELPAHVEVIQMATMQISDVINEISRRGIQSLYVEGGSTTHDSFLAAGYWDEIVTYISPSLLGGNSLAGFQSERTVSTPIQLHDVQCEQIGGDYRIRGRRKNPCLPD